MNIKQNYKKIIGISLIINVIVISLIMMLVSSQTSNTFTITSGIYPSAVSYTIWIEGSNYYSKNAYGEIEFSGSDARTVIQNSIDATDIGRVFITAGLYPNIKPAIEMKTGVELVGEKTLNIGGLGNLSTVLDMALDSTDYLIKKISSYSGEHGMFAIRDLKLRHSRWQSRYLNGTVFGEGSGVSNANSTIFFKLCSSILIENVEVEGGGDAINLVGEGAGIYINAGEQQRLQNVYVCHTRKNAIVITDNYRAVLSNLIIDGVVTNPEAYTASLLLANAQVTVVINSQFGHSGGNHIRLWKGDSNQIINNQMWDASVWNDATYDGIVLESLLNRTVIFGNTKALQLSGTTDERYGIHVTSSEVTDTRIISNTFYPKDGDWNAKIYNNGGINTLVKYNAGFITENSGEVTGSSPLVVASGLAGQADYVVLGVKSATAYKSSWYPINATHFNIYHDAGGSITLSWHAFYYP